jgi:hypothetical protein
MVCFRVLVVVALRVTAKKRKRNGALLKRQPARPKSVASVVLQMATRTLHRPRTTEGRGKKRVCEEDTHPATILLHPDEEVR